MRPSSRWLSVMLVLCVVLALGAGWTRVFVQRADPPAWALINDNTFEGFVTIDGYARLADALRAWLAGESGGWDALLEHLRNSRHPTALLLPLAIALLALATGSIPIAFLSLSSLAFVLGVSLATRLGARLVPEHPREAGRIAGILVAAHFLSLRTAGSLILDPFTALFALLGALLALRLLERPSRRDALLLFTVQLSGCFLKLSWLPFLAAPALIACGAARAERARRALRAALLFGALPALPLLLYLWLGPGSAALSAESRMAVGSWRLTPAYLLEYAVELALIFQLLPWLLASRSALAVPAVRALLFAALPALAANLLVRPPINPRLYLGPLALLLVAATPELMRRARERLGLVLSCYAGANAALALLSLLALLRR